MNAKNSKTRAILTAVAAAMVVSPSFAAVPILSGGVTMTQAADRLVTIAYTLAGAPAVVTVDVQTNATTSASADDPGWTSIGGEAIWNAMGDVWKVVEPGSRTITWHPDHSWPGHIVSNGGARAVLTAWPVDNTPNYMVVDLIVDNNVRYYPSVDYLPGSVMGQKGAVTNNIAYKTNKLVMRKIMARGVEWTMGTAATDVEKHYDRERPHSVTLTNNYYIGVFEMTQAQWKNISTNTTFTAQFFKVDSDVRPMEKVSYNDIRIKPGLNATAAEAATSAEILAFSWPKAPHPSSFLGLLRAKTGLDFDLPSEAQWEFAARSGHGSGYWNDGSAIMNSTSDANLGNLGRYKGNNPGTGTSTSLGPDEGGTDRVGAHAPSSWGLYDMHGNVWEWCLDWYESDNVAPDGRVNIDPEMPTNTLSENAGSNRVLRGGSHGNDPKDCRPAHGKTVAATSRSNSGGFRVICTNGLQ